MNPDEILREKIIEMLKNDFSELQQCVNEIMNNKYLDKKKLGEAYFAVQKNPNGVIQVSLAHIIT